MPEVAPCMWRCMTLGRTCAVREVIFKTLIKACDSVSRTFIENRLEYFNHYRIIMPSVYHSLINVQVSLG